MSYNLKHISNNNILNKLTELNKFMLSNDLIDSMLSVSSIKMLNNVNKVVQDKVNKKNTNIENITKSSINKLDSSNSDNNKINNDFIILKEQDKKFWYFYMFVNNYELCDLPSQYERFKIQTEEKIKYVEELAKTDNSIFKQYKISKKNIQSSLSDIKNNISLEDLIGLSILYKKNLIYICDNMYYEIGAGLTSNNNDWNIIVKNNDTLEKIPINEKKEEFYNKVREGINYYKIDNITKPIKSISSFTIDQLANIANKLNISIERENGKKKLKKDLYDEILIKLNNFK